MIDTKRLSATGLAGALLLALPLASCSSEEAPQAQKAPAGPRLVLAATDTALWQDVSAEIATVDQAQVIARIPGILTSLSVREGDLVRKGQVIGRIVDNQLGYQAGAYGAQAAAARREHAQAAAAAAGAQVNAARQQQSAVQAVAGQGAVVAPTSGRILRADVPAGAPVAPGMTIAVVTAGATIVRLEMPESLAEKVRPGAAVLAEGIGQGRVVKVYPSVTAGKVSADVEVPGIDNSLIGKRVPAKVAAGQRKAILVPTSFITTRYGIDMVTLLAKDGTATQVPVQIAPSLESGKVEILSGVAQGDTLIGAGSK